MKIGESNCPCDVCGKRLNSNNWKIRNGSIRKYFFGMIKYYYWDGGVCKDCSPKTSEAKDE